MFKNTNSKRMTGILLALVLVTSLFIGGSIARYVTSTSSENEARVAVWGINEAGTTMDLFDNEYKLEDNTVVANSEDGDNIIAPGLNGLSEFKIVEANANLKPEVMYEIKINLDDSEIADEIKNHPGIEWKVDEGNWCTWEEFKTSLLSLSGDASGVKTYAPGTVAPEFANGKKHTVAWQWIMDSGYDVEDTAMGNLAATDQNITAKLIITVTARQVDTDTTGLLNGDGQVYNIYTPQDLVFRSSEPFTELQSVNVDNTTLEKNTDYIATEGSTVITLKESYLKTLSAGNYTISIISENNTVTASFKVSDGKIVHNGIIPKGAIYYTNATKEIEQEVGDYSSAINSYVAGEEFPELSLGDTYVYKNYEYRYGYAFDGTYWSSYDMYGHGEIDGWGVKVIDTSATTFNNILANINGENVVSMTVAFSGCSNIITAPEIPNTIVYMEHAFSSSTITKTPFIPDSVLYMDGTFDYCTNLTTITNIPNNVISLNNTFAWDTNIEKVENSLYIPPTVNNLANAFQDCEKLVGTITIDANPTNYKYAIYNTGISEILGDCPENKKQEMLAESSYIYYLPEGATYFDKSINTYIPRIPDTIETGDIYSYGDYEYKYNAFYSNGWNENGTSSWGVTVKDRTKSSYGEILDYIGDYPVENLQGIFQNCINLKYAPTIPNTAKDMNWSFQNCSSLLEVPNIPNGVRGMANAFENCKKLTHIPELPDSIVDMYLAFSNCENIETITNLPANLWDGNGMFSGCKTLKSIPTIPNKVVNLGAAFSGCTSLTSAPAIPASVSDLGYTFFGCTNLIGSIEINTNEFGYNYQDALYGTKITEITGDISSENAAKILATKTGEY